MLQSFFTSNLGGFALKFNISRASVLLLEMPLAGVPAIMGFPCPLRLSSATATSRTGILSNRAILDQISEYLTDWSRLKI